MRLDSYTIRRYVEDLRYRITSRGGPRPKNNTIIIAALSTVCAVCFTWIVYRSLPSPSTARLTQQQTFLVSANNALVADSGEDSERFAMVTILQQESGDYDITGTVRTQNDLDHLRQRLEALNPRGSLSWNVTVESP